MTDMHAARRGYGQVKRQMSSDKHIEIELFSTVTARLNTHKNSNDDSDLRLSPDMARDLLENAKLWQILMLDLLSADNQLDMSLKNSLISLAEFTQSHTQKVFRGDGTIDVLIDVNTAILNGLKTALSAGQRTGQSAGQDSGTHQIEPQKMEVA